MINTTGFVSFVGAGPGDIGLITKKAIECLQKADVVLYDRLANPRLLRYTKGSCEFIYCGKLPMKHILRQEKINEKLIELASAGKYVVRLKGGDPSVFGRVGEEAEALAEANLPYEIVPGITSSVAAAAYAGIPVTHRQYSNTLTLKSGHSKDPDERFLMDKKEVRASDTFAFYMGVKNLPFICEEMIKNGKPSDTKAAVIEWATTGKQRVVEGTLEDITAKVKEYGIKNPALTIVGSVVSLRSSIQWFEKKKYYGRRILIAKSTSDSNFLEEYFSSQGAEAFSFPTFHIKENMLSEQELTDILNSKRIIFTSPESVTIFFDQLRSNGYDIRDIPRSVQYLSEKTRKVLAAKGIIGEKVTQSEENTSYIGHKEAGNYTEQYGEGKVYHIYDVSVDVRFDEVNERVLNEDSWQVVIFPNKAAVDCYVKELQRLDINLTDISFAYIGKSVKEYALSKGFLRVDSEMQAALQTDEWKGTE